MEQKLRICKCIVCWAAKDSFNLYSNKIYIHISRHILIFRLALKINRKIVAFIIYRRPSSKVIFHPPPRKDACISNIDPSHPLRPKRLSINSIHSHCSFRPPQPKTNSNHRSHCYSFPRLFLYPLYHSWPPSHSCP